MGSIAEQMNESSPGANQEITAELPEFETVLTCLRGFGGAPKFPIPHHLLFLLRYWKQFQKPRALEMVERTLLLCTVGYF